MRRIVWALTGLVIFFPCALFLTGTALAAEPNLVAWWKFDEGTGGISYDSAGDNDGILVNAPVWTSGKIGGGLSFDGINDYVDVPDNAALRFTKSSSFSICSWAKPMALSGEYCMQDAIGQPVWAFYL